MLSRRRFLGTSGLGILGASVGCRPASGQLATVTDVLPNDQLGESHRDQSKHRLLGYPINMNTPSAGFFHWREELTSQGIDTFAFNNVGNPFKPSPIPFNTHDYERATILAFAKRYGLRDAEAWGFLSHSGTDSNMHGMYMGRTILKGRTGRIPKVYYTQEAHYSVQILSDLLGLEHELVGTQADGAMDPDDLLRRVSRHGKHPALVVATVGTTFKGAVDDVAQIRQRLSDHNTYLHVDAALFGGYLPFTPYHDKVSFALDHSRTGSGYDSLAVSCHKFFGFPNPAGLFITKRAIYDEFNDRFSRIHNPAYIHQVPGTITCSRDATKPAEFYYFTTREATDRQVEDAQLILDNAEYLFDELRTRFPQLHAHRANPMSNTVYFRAPSDDIIRKYSLATMDLPTDTEAVRFAHVVVMPHVSRAVLDEFLGDLNG